MTAYADLGLIDYFPVADASALRAVGWLARWQPFRTGTVSPEFFGKLSKLLVDPFQPLVTAGRGTCDLCQFSSGPHELRYGDVLVPLGASNLFVPGVGVIYVSPSLVAHYIDGHEYRPPDEFLEAVLRCPQTRTMEYRRLLLAAGGRGLIAPA